MSPEAQRIAIAEACNLKPDGMEWCKDGYCYRDKTGNIYGCLPDYLNDLNAMHSAEEALSTIHKAEYAHQLTLVTLLRRSEPLYYPEGMAMDLVEDFEFAHATAAQRAEAFLKTIGKWTE